MLLTRDDLGPIRTMGELSIDGAFECFTLEDTVRPEGEKVWGKTAIPSGRYKVIIDHSPHFGRAMPLLLDVPAFEGVRVHWGNTERDTDGCVIVGRRRDRLAVYDSRAAFDALFAKLQAALADGGECWITIKNRPAGGGSS